MRSGVRKLRSGTLISQPAALLNGKPEKMVRELARIPGKPYQLAFMRPETLQG
jgi:hypothetical protein